MIKKICMSITFALLAVLSVFGLFSNKVNAMESTETSQSVEVVERGLPTFVNTTLKELGIPNTMAYNWTRSDYRTKLTTYEANGFVYTITEGAITDVTVSTNASQYKEIGFLDYIEDMFIDPTHYHDLDYTVFISATTVIFEREQDYETYQKLGAELPAVENIIVMHEGYPPIVWNENSTVKNIIMGCPTATSNIGTWTTRQDFDLSLYPKGIKFVTCEPLKWTYGKYLESYKDHENYFDEPSTIYVITDEELEMLVPDINYSNYTYKEMGGVIWVRTTYGSDVEVGYSVAYIDPVVTKIVIDGLELNNDVHPHIGYHKLRYFDQIYCLDGTQQQCIQYFNSRKTVINVPTNFVYKYFHNSEKVYFYGTQNKSFYVTSASVESGTTIKAHFYLPDSTFTFSNGSVRFDSDDVTRSYTEVFIPEIEIKVGDDIESTTEFYAPVEIIKEQLQVRLNNEGDMQAKARRVDEIIVNLPSLQIISIEDKELVAQARAAYENLPAEAKTYVTQLVKLTTLETKMESLAIEAEQIAADKAKAAEVEKKIGKLPVTISIDDKLQIEVARKAYNELTSIQRSYVQNLHILEAAEQVMAEIEIKEAQRVELMKRRAQEVDDLISDIPDAVVLESKLVIQIAREAYDLLTVEEKTYVVKYGKLRMAEVEYSRLVVSQGKTEEELKVIKDKAAKVDELITALPENIRLTDKAKVKAARQAYEDLDKDCQPFVDGIDDLIKAEQKIQELEDKANDTVEDIKDKVNTSKPLKVVLICFSIVLGLGLIYGIYVLVRKIIKWLK